MKDDLTLETKARAATVLFCLTRCPLEKKEDSDKNNPWPGINRVELAKKLAKDTLTSSNTLDNFIDSLSEGAYEGNQVADLVYHSCILFAIDLFTHMLNSRHKINCHNPKTTALLEIRINLNGPMHEDLPIPYMIYTLAENLNISRANMVDFFKRELKKQLKKKTN